MAEAILSPIVKQIIGTLGSAAVEEIKSLWNVEADLDDLEDTIKTVKAVLIDAQKRQIHEEQVRVWLEKLEDVVYLADDLLDEISTEGLQRQLMTPDQKENVEEQKENVEEKVCIFFSCFSQQAFRIFFSCFDQVAFRHEMAGKIEEVRSKLDKIAADRERFRFEENMRDEETNAARRSAGRETRSFVPEEDVIGRDADKREILKLLLETNTHGEKVSVIPIVGMGGLGKTTLAQLVFNDESVQRRFDPKIWVCVSDNFDERFIMEKIVEIVSPKESKTGLGLERLQNILQEKLIGKRYLLVLDDVWNENPQKWKNLRGLLMSFAEGSKIIVTTRSRNVADVMRTYIQPYDLGILNPENSWSLFKQLAFEQGQEHNNSATEEVGKKIVGKCRGVPLAISMIGSMLCHRNPETDWPFFLKNEVSNIFQEENNILPILKLSYDCLPSHLKHCIAYCSLFPKDYGIGVRTLVQLWIAQGFIKSSNPSQSLEDIGYRCFMELLWRSFFQEGKRDKFDKVFQCKMHDLVHDLAMQVAGGEYAMLKLGERSIDKRVHHVSCEFYLSSSNDVPSSLLQAKRLRSILLPNQFEYYPMRDQGETICDLIVLNFKFLRMLDLQFFRIKKLPNSIGKLKHLRYLDLSDNEKMKALPTCITELVNLQTLKLNRCLELEELPRDINKLVNLQRLELNRCLKLKELPRDINKLVNLRHLEFGIFISQMPRGLGQLTNLQTLSYFVLSSEGTNLESPGSELDELSGLKNLSGKLEIRGLRGGLETKGANLKEKQNLRSLSLRWSDGDADGDENDSDVDIDEKHEMTIEGLHPHPNLRELILEGYEGVTLSSWLPSLTNLVDLELFNCPKCRHLPPLSHLPSLKKMRLRRLPCLEYIVNDDVDVGGTNFWTSLQELRMEELPKLKGWWRLPDDVAENQVKLPSFPPCFSRLTIHRCPELSCMPLYPSVEYLRLIEASWKTFEETAALKAEDEASSSSSSSSPLSKLTDLALTTVVDIPESLPNWMKSLTSLKVLCIVNNAKLKYPSPVIQYLTSLQYLWIGKCEELIEICNGDSIKWEALSSLRILTFEGQPNLVTLPEGLQRATTLQSLTIWECRNFMAIPDWICNLCSLGQLNLTNCPNLKSLPASISSLMSLQTLQIEGCPTLSERCKRPTGEDWHKIQHIPDVYVKSIIQR